MTDSRSQSTETSGSGAEVAGHGAGAPRGDDSGKVKVKAKARLPGRRAQMTPAEQLEIVRRVRDGEGQSAIALELGYSRQRISAIMKKFESGGAEGFVHRKRGPKAGPVPAEEIAKLITMLRDQTPSEFGFKKAVKWTFEKAEVASVKVWGRKAPKRHLRAAFKQAGVELAYDTDPDADIFTPEFEAYRRSAKAREIREREAEYHKRLEEQGLVNRPRKLGRPTKAETARRAAQPWNPDVRGGASQEETKPGDTNIAPPPDTGAESRAETEVGEAEVPDWNNLTPEEMKAMQAKFNMASYLPGSGQRQPGTRVGKHRKQKAPNAPGRKKRKKGKKGGKRR